MENYNKTTNETIQKDEDMFIADLSIKPENEGEDPRHETHHHHRHHHHRRHGFRLFIKILIGILIAVLCMGGTVLAAWQIMNQVGKKELYANTASSGPDLAAAVSGNESSQGENWQAGWIRYKGGVYTYNSNILTFLIMGIDNQNRVRTAKDGISGGQADAIFLLAADPDARKFSVISVNRNTMTDIDVYDQKGAFVGSGVGQICLQHGYGDGKEQSCEREEKAVSNLFYNLPINGYCALNMGAFSEINNAVGGVTVDVLEDCTAWGDKRLTKGNRVKLTGKEAYTYIRYRNEAAFDSASARLLRQEQYLGGFAGSLKSGVKSDPSLVLDIFNRVKPYMVTDIDASKVTYMATNMIGYSFDSSGIYSLKGTTAVGKTKHEEFTYDEEQLYDLIIKVFYHKVEGIE
ncbi:MAG: LCP family protein [Butyrivibrio sp.]|nr:LCP family protein [Butyrivibrio sp.]